MQTMATEITHARLPRSFSCTSRTVTSVQFVRGRAFNPPLVEDDPLLVTVKFGLGVGFNPNRKVKIPNSSSNHYKLMSGIIQTHLQKTFLYAIVCT